MSRSQGGRADEVRRARIVLGLAGGQTLAAVSRRQACSVNTVKLWRKRFLEGRLSGLWGRHPGKAVAAGTERLEARIMNWTLQRKQSPAVIQRATSLGKNRTLREPNRVVRSRPALTSFSRKL
jgi:hypothetical protein